MEPRNVVEHGLRRAIVSVAVIAATLLEIIDTTIVNVALPNIQGNFGVPIDQGAWIVTGYIIANVIVIPITPWLAARFGRRQYFFASIIIFTIAFADVRPRSELWIARLLAHHPGPGRRRFDLDVASNFARHLHAQRAGASAGHLRDGRDRRTGAWARCSAAGSPTISPGAGRSSSICRSASRQRR